ncbi:nitrite/sulfite reductase [Azospira inquinata]|uniref:Nitrite/sulfite reductase n=1 Tax=Azospira inquinata TaxID=2785627 RepID=A0A975SN49_9RHOO|nr:nitrite/sulfite reductase [Azospira inquinata]QWT45266.1 nitrite/sulfite reductase [Azospira inquinata]QWT49402.1 nitrite/sulfite reductase [Azospira inquinata]
MYQYNEDDKRFLQERVSQFRGQVQRWQSGELSNDEFKPLRLQNGLYVQRYAPMFRIAVPYGLLAARQLRRLARIARDYDKGYGHFTTRHNLQFNWIPIERVPDALGELAEVNLHAIQTSGNCIRNVTSDQLAGVAPDEILDPRPFAEIVRQWSTFHPEFAFLPRKFKIAISGAREDRALTWFHDVGLRLVEDAQGEPGFQVIVGGGLGRTPIRGQEIKAFLPWAHLLTYLEAIVRTYNRYGRRDNAFKARIKILVQALGVEKFAAEVDLEWQYLKDGPSTLTREEYDRVAQDFAAPAYQTLPAQSAAQEQLAATDKAFARWLERNVAPHRVPGYAAVTLSLKAPGRAPGDVTAEQMDLVADLAERYSFGELRVTHEQNLVLADVVRDQLPDLWREARAAGLATPNIGLLTDIICCPGGDFCDLANAKSIPIANALQARFEDLDYLYDIGDLELNISGCMNSCGHHHVGHIGILGVDKGKEEWYQITLGGRQGNDARLGKVLGPSIPGAEVPDAVETIIRLYIDNRQEGESFLQALDRIGTGLFKETLFGARLKGVNAAPAA